MRKFIVLLWLSFYFTACSTIPITGRKRINLVSDKQILPASFSQYTTFLKENELATDTVATDQIKSIGNKIAKAVDQFMRANGMTAEADDYEWEFNLVEDNTVNAWCLPGGKVVFYTGILPICANEDGIAAVMGHEVAHAFAKHGQERMTQTQLQQYGGAAVALGTSGTSEKSQAIWNTAFGITSQVGLLAYSRTHESEADKLGLVFMIMAGYDGNEAAEVWVRMSEKAGGGGGPEFLSTHPSNESRINTLRAYLPEAKKIAAKYKTK